MKYKSYVKFNVGDLIVRRKPDATYKMGYISAISKNRITNLPMYTIQWCIDGIPIDWHLYSESDLRHILFSRDAYKHYPVVQ
jgi:hypothetical protein